MKKNKQKIDKLVCVCAKSDLSTWIIASEYIVNNIESNSYLLVVPDNEVDLFLQYTTQDFLVEPESKYIGNLKNKITNSTSVINRTRVGWYLQQFIKLAVLKNAAINEYILIWDADTIPIKKIKFFNAYGVPLLFKGTEHHQPYFDCIDKLLEMEKKVTYSFIAQCILIRGQWAKAFFAEIENIHKKKWDEAMLSVINFDEQSGFSEYETLGTFLTHKYPNEFKVRGSKWLRCGQSFLGCASNLNNAFMRFIFSYFYFISFEKWDTKSFLPKFGNKLFFLFRKIIGSAENQNDVDIFLNSFFKSPDQKLIIQVGANDGIQNDFLRKYLQYPGNYTAILFEPIPYYVDKLKDLYKYREDISIVNSAAGEMTGVKKLYFISPDTADEMNGTGPLNNWAHGQGSFDKNNIIYWINKNSFRGDEYVRNIDRYINAINEIDVPVIKVGEVISSVLKTLLVVDVQGFELEVLKGIDWSQPPDFIMVEDDIGSHYELSSYLNLNGYSYLCGKTDKIYSRESIIK